MLGAGFVRTGPHTGAETYPTLDDPLRVKAIVYPDGIQERSTRRNEGDVRALVLTGATDGDPPHARRHGRCRLL